jgi:acyl-homoserine lactone acylase PvdQ
MFYGRSAYGAFGCTAINPDVLDLFSETIKDGQYFYDGTWHGLEMQEEIIKVRFGFEVKH